MLALDNVETSYLEASPLAALDRHRRTRKSRAVAASTVIAASATYAASLEALETNIGMPPGRTRDVQARSRIFTTF